MSENKFTWNEFLKNNLATTVILVLGGLSCFYAQDKRIAVLEAQINVHDKQIVEIKIDQKEDFNRVENKIDKIYTIVNNLRGYHENR